MADELKEELVAHAEELVGEKKVEEARETAEELESVDEKEAIAWFVKGRVHYAAEEFEEALSSFSQAAKIANENPEIWHMMGYALISLKRYKEARDALEYVVNVEPENVEARCALGICMVILGDGLGGRAHLAAAVGKDRGVAVGMLEHFHEKFLGTSKEASASTKALIERALETLKLSGKL